MSMIPYSCKFWIYILEMFNKSLPYIIFNKWTFIDLMSNYWQYVQCGEFSLGTPFTQWIPLFQSLGTLLTMLPFYWLNLGSMYLTLTATRTPSITIVSTLRKTTISCLVTSTNSTPLGILIPWVATSCSTT